MRRHRVSRWVAVAGAVTALAAVLPASAGPSGHEYKAPFKVGPSGGDVWSYHNASSDGTVTVARVYAIPGAINCTKGAPYAKLRVPLQATGPVRKPAKSA